MNRPWVTLILMGSTFAISMGCERMRASHASRDPHGQHGSHANGSHGEREDSPSRPTNQVAVVTVWAEAKKLEATVEFYTSVLGLQRLGTSTEPYVFDAGGTFVVIMEGKLESPRNPRRRWPMFAFSVPDLGESVKKLGEAKVELTWGIEEHGAPEPTSRYVMFHDPAGNLIELVQWL